MLLFKTRPHKVEQFQEKPMINTIGNKTLSQTFNLQTGLFTMMNASSMLNAFPSINQPKANYDNKVRDLIASVC